MFTRNPTTKMMLEDGDRRWWKIPQIKNLLFYVFLVDDDHINCKIQSHESKLKVKNENLQLIFFRAAVNFYIVFNNMIVPRNGIGVY